MDPANMQAMMQMQQAMQQLQSSGMMPAGAMPGLGGPLGGGAGRLHPLLPPSSPLSRDRHIYALLC